MIEATLGKHETGPGAICSPAGRITRSLLGWGVVAGPFYVIVALGQALLRPGFDLLHDDVSLLSNGSLGYIQIANFLLTGAMVIACAVGVRRVLAGGRAGTWGPILLGIYGLGLIGAGIFAADPMSGFPPGAPAGHPATVSLHGILHIASAGIGFLGFAAACFVIGQRFARDDQSRLAWSSRLTGVVFLAGFGAIASGSNSAAVVLGFWMALLIAWAWLATVCVALYRRVS